MRDFVTIYRENFKTMFMLVRGGVAPAEEREELEGAWELAEDWASKHNNY